MAQLIIVQELFVFSSHFKGAFRCFHHRGLSYASDYDILVFEFISYLLFLWIFALEQKIRQNIAGSVLS